MISAIIVPVATIIEAGGLSQIFSTLDQMDPIFMDWTVLIKKISSGF